MTVEELRVVERFLDECAAQGITNFKELKAFAGARILGSELHEAGASDEAAFAAAETFFQGEQK